MSDGPPSVSRDLDISSIPAASVAELKAECWRRRIDTSGLLEKSELVEALQSASYYDDPDLHTVCAVCGNGDDEEGNDILLCDGRGCRAAYHLKCLPVPLLAIPHGEWLCPGCAAQACRVELMPLREVKAELLRRGVGTVGLLEKQELCAALLAAREAASRCGIDAYEDPPLKRKRPEAQAGPTTAAPMSRGEDERMQPAASTDLAEAVAQIVRDHDLDVLTPRLVRAKLEERLALPPGSLRSEKEQLVQHIDRALEELRAEAEAAEAEAAEAEAAEAQGADRVATAAEAMHAGFKASKEYKQLLSFQREFKRARGKVPRRGDLQREQPALVAAYDAYSALRSAT